MLKHLVTLGNTSKQSIPKIRVLYYDTQFFRLYTSSGKKDGQGSDKTGRTKLVSECTPKPLKPPSPEICSPAQQKGSGGAQPYPPDAPKDCKRPHIDTCPPAPKGPDCIPGIQKVNPRIQECGKPSMMDDMPQPDCPWDDQNKKKQRTYNWVLLLGALFAAGSIYALTKLDLSTKPDDSQPVKKKKKKSKRRPFIITKNPPLSQDIPSKVPYVLIGGGTASFAAFRAIKSNDPTAKVLVIGSEPFFPYMRPPLSKELFYSDDRAKAEQKIFKQWNGQERSVFYEPDDFYTDCKELLESKNGGVAVARGWIVKKIDVVEQKIYLEDNKQISYEKCLIATGAQPKNLPVFEEADDEIKQKVTLYRNLFDFDELEDIIADGAKSIAIVGGGFLGSELACALAQRGKSQRLQVTQIFKENGNMGKVLPDYLCKWVTKKVKKQGVDVITNAEVEDVDLDKKQLVLSLSNGKKVKADQVIVAVGVEPNTQLAEASDLEVDKEEGGFVVNAELEARTNLYSAGDCACFFDIKLGRRRVEHHDQAVVSGRLAGENMSTDKKSPYKHQSMLWSDLGPDIGYEAIGRISSDYPTVGVYAKVVKDEVEEQKAADEQGEDQTAAEASKEEQEKEEYDKGVIFYLKEGVVVGIVMWNIYNRMNIARQVLEDENKYEDLNEVAKLFNIHEQ